MHVYSRDCSFFIELAIGNRWPITSVSQWDANSILVRDAASDVGASRNSGSHVV